MKKDILKIVLETIDYYNQDLDEDSKIKKDLEAPLYGSKSNLDSLGLVSFIVCLEQDLEEKLNKTFSLADEKAMSRKSSPYESINTLVDLIIERS
jgi:acyl carrier protein